MIINLPHRALVRLSKPDAVDFLNDLITAAVPAHANDGIRPAALLTPQGRILFDLLISRDGDDILIELDEDRRDAFIKKMMMYRLRRDVGITADPQKVHAVIGACDDAVVTDTRFPNQVARLYREDHDSDVVQDVNIWTALRYEHGVAEGAAELPPEKALPLEARLDLNDGISFEKGCYIGQEVTARTRYRGLVKRSYLPVVMNTAISTPHDITANGKVVGEVLGVVDHDDQVMGLASIRLDAVNNEVPLLVADETITPLYPERLMPLPARKDA